jgi:superfamily II DNA helicase RecQ
MLGADERRITMKMQFFTISIADLQAATDALNAFLAAHRVVHVERHFVAEGANSVWSICVSYTEGESRPAADRRQQKKVDYRDTLSEPQFAVFAKLRTLRKTLADQEGVPAYALFTNEQLADMVRRPVLSLESLAGLDGVGQARVEKYGGAFLRLLKESRPALTNGVPEGEVRETSGDSS